ncbi:hypothetical protein ACFCWD_29145 [Streptomyces sp. NPDC056374]|uniref:hypothetical protein n=1 Tax=unclassified Streptomyces TaxID=2593676 RepID=UPI0035D82827
MSEQQEDASGVIVNEYVAAHEATDEAAKSDDLEQFKAAEKNLAKKTEAYKEDLKARGFQPPAGL